MLTAILAAIAVVIAAIGIAGLIFFLSLVGGTILWMIWPTAMYAFPGLVGSGAIEPNLTWWQSVCLVWVFGILVKATQTNNNK